MAKTLRQHRHRARIFAMQAIFQWDFRPHLGIEELAELRWIDYQVPEEEKRFACEIIRLTLQHREDIDTLIEEHLIGWSFSRLTRVTRAILRTAVAQICYMAGDVAPAVIIDESIMLARKYDDDSAVPFINGVLDSIVRTLLPPDTPPPRSEKIRIKRSAVKKSNPP